MNLRKPCRSQAVHSSVKDSAPYLLTGIPAKGHRMNLYRPEHKTVFLLEGVGLIILGSAAILLPGLFTLGLEILFAVLLIIGGSFRLSRAIHCRGLPAFWPSLIEAVLLLIAGILLLTYPLSGILTLTVLLAVLFAVSGVSETLLAVHHRENSSWIWILFSGIASLAIAILLLAGWPSTAQWAIGLLAGINLLLSGWWLIMVGSGLPISTN